MSIEIHQPEIEALIHQRMAGEAFLDVEEVLIYALRAAPTRPARSAKPFGKTLVESFDELRRISGGVELDIRRDPSPGRDVDLS